ncbi:helix-turn-helix domain-containing protein [Quadrisphaera sp. INWT6]|uniref:helix-turn-helix domain-containing protein n=1 Tax=Quadrisphaera sp. INWT6 TaxID=2596917 RepID=UPI001892757C|nr:helix-turn-helix transcriptional regulator [Quadrisphaera sp. INWT6]MBF5082358.1 helix-turn-helix transcriptional regulator [Quadrisphaera sp. INWT6]
MAGDAAELAVAVRQWRERLAPGDVGLPNGSVRRRTPGLRREEVAHLAGLSVDYVVRLEQGRGPRPSATVLMMLSGALLLSPPEIEHLFALAGAAVPTAGAISDVVRPSVLRLLDRLHDLPAMVSNAQGDVLAWNELASAVLGDLSKVPHWRRTHLWLHFVADETFASRLVVEGTEGARLDRATVAQARAALARYPQDTKLLRTVDELRERVPRFAAVWDERPLQHRHSDVKSYDVPGVGRITLDCESLAVLDDDQTLVVYSAAPDSTDAVKLEKLRTDSSR